MTHAAKKGISRVRFRGTAPLLLILTMIIALSLFTGCSAKDKLLAPDENELRITDSGIITIDDSWFRYYVVIENLTDRPLNDLTVIATAYDENDEKIHARDYDSQPAAIQMHEGEANVGYIAPKGKTLYVTDVNIHTKYAEYEAIPARMEFSLSSPDWADEEANERLEVTDFTEFGTYDAELCYWDPDTDAAVYEGSETYEEVSITIKNTGEQDYVMTEDHWFNVGAVYRDDAGNVVGTALATLDKDGADMSKLTIPAGEEVCFDVSTIPYTPYKSVEFFVTCFDFQP